MLKDAAGTYYLVARDTVEQGRVPDEQAAELERLMAEAAEDTQGFSAPLLWGAGP